MDWSFELFLQLSPKDLCQFQVLFPVILSLYFGRMSPHMGIGRVTATLIALRSPQDSCPTRLLQMTLDYKKISYFGNRWQPGFCLLVFRWRFLLFSWELPLTVCLAQSHQQMRQFVMHKKPHSSSHLSPCVCYHAPAACFHTHYPYTILMACKIWWTNLMTSEPHSKISFPTYTWPK